MTTGYIICLIAAVGLLVAYSVVVKTKEFWLTMLHVCVTVVNLGYLFMSLANTVEFAVFGNDAAGDFYAFFGCEWRMTHENNQYWHSCTR